MYVVPFIATFVAAFLLTPVVKRVALWKNIVDRPNGDPLKIHTTPTPLFGGAAIFIAMLIGLFIYNVQFSIAIALWIRILVITCSGLIIFILGLFDDIKKIKPLYRLVVHIFISGIIAFSGLPIFFLPLKFIAIVFTL